MTSARSSPLRTSSSRCGGPATTLWQRFGRRLFVYGHSAGGHLAACMVATDWPSLYPKAPADLVPAGYSLSGLFDLAPLLKTSTNQDLKLDAETAQAVSPQFWPLPPGRVLDTVVGALESSEFIRQSREVTEAWRQGGAETRYEEIAAMNHFTIVDGLTDPQNPMTARVAELAQRIQERRLWLRGWLPAEQRAGGCCEDQCETDYVRGCRNFAEDKHRGEYADDREPSTATTM